MKIQFILIFLKAETCFSAFLITMGVIIIKIFHTCLRIYCTENTKYARKGKGKTRRATSRTVWAESLQNFAKFLPLPNVTHLPAWGALKIDKSLGAKPKISAIFRL